MAYPSNSRIPPERLVRHPQVVYVIKPAGLEFVKIGITRRICQRLYELQAGCPRSLRVVAMFPGGPDLEARLHYTFVGYHSHGEWFGLGPDIKRMLADMHQPGFDIEAWLQARFCGKPPPMGDVKRYIGGKVTLGKRQTDFGDPEQKPPRSGKLAEADVRFILENPENETNAALARRFNVSRMMITHIRKGRSWSRLRDAA